MAPLTTRDDFPGPSSVNPGVIIAIIAGVLIALSIFITIVRAASRAQRSPPRTSIAPRAVASSGNATDYLRQGPPGNRPARTAGNNDTFSTAWMVENNNLIMTTVNSNAAGAATAASASPPAVHAPHMHHDHPAPPPPAAPPSGPTDTGPSCAQASPDPPPPYSAVM